MPEPKPTLKTRLTRHRVVLADLVLPTAAEVAVRNQRRGFWDGLIFVFTASLMLWQDLPAVQVIVVMVVMLGAALMAIRSNA